MRHTVILLALAGLLAGCGENFPDEEMHLGLEAKVRPYGVTVQPPDAAPGDTVTVTLLAWAPDPDALDISWRAALDFDRGLYETDGVERRYVAVAAPPPVADADGFLRQTFTWVVPDSTLLWTSALPEVLDDPAMIALAGALLGEGASSPPRRDEVEAWLRALTPADLAAMEPQEREATWALADRFACQVRLRASLRTDLLVDVTRNLTVRHTRRLAGPNLNHNADIVSFAIAAVRKPEADRGDLADPLVEKTWHRFIDNGMRVNDNVQVPVESGVTYYAVVSFTPELYDSPFGYTDVLSETGSYRWYYLRQDDPTAADQLFRTEDGGEAEMWSLKREARLDPPGPGSRFRLVAGVRDERSEWVSYHAVPGATFVEGIVEFVAPGSGSTGLAVIPVGNGAERAR